METPYVFLAFFAFLAGLVDSVVGGGGLIQLPALLVAFPTYPVTLLFGTNKFSSVFGTLVAAAAAPLNSCAGCDRRFCIRVSGGALSFLA
jgi:uncharacterized membrane protein YfcA